VLGIDALADDPALATNAGRVTHRDRVVGAVAGQVRTRTAAQVAAALDAVGVPCGTVRTVLEALRDAGASALTGVAPSVPGAVRFPPPRLDEHGADIRARGWAVFRG
jgi:crotonobetainyl-CoA:carnitine CoA-transferase CaiB-like acyl-CoA transferase